MSRGLFVTGTDTGVGKTWVALGVMSALAREGFAVVGMKPVASGCRCTAAGLRNEDAERIQAGCSVPLGYDEVNPFAFEPAIAPHIAAAEAGVEISVARIAATYRSVAGRADWCVVEGVGGWLVPLGAQDTVADLAERLALPVLLVVGMRLGCLNHALLTAESVRAHGRVLTGWVANSPTEAIARLDRNIAALEARMPAPLLGVVPWFPRGPSVERVHAALSGIAKALEARSS